LGALAVATGSDGKKSLGLFLDQNGIDVPSMVVAKFDEYLRGSSMFLEISPQNAQAKFSLEVLEYGLEKSWPLGKASSFLLVQATLTDTAGKVAWTHCGYLRGMEDCLPARTIEGWLSDPE
jgi:hypothetical protein